MVISYVFSTNSRSITATKFGKIFLIAPRAYLFFGLINMVLINNTPPRGYVCLKKKRFNQKTGNEISIKLGKKFANRYIYYGVYKSDSLIIKNPKLSIFQVKM